MIGPPDFENAIENSGEEERIIQAMERLEPTGDLLGDLNDLLKIKGHTLESVLSTVFTEKKIKATDPAAVYEQFQGPKAQGELNEKQDNPAQEVFIRVFKKILKKYEETRIRN